VDDENIPHRDKLNKIILEQFNIEYKAMINRIQVCFIFYLHSSFLLNKLQNSAGRVSFTSDIWSRLSLSSHIAVTAHYIAKTPSGHYELRQELVAFRQIKGSHTGKNIAKVILDVIEDIGCKYRVRTFAFIFSVS
jgi:hypothetical protein